MAKKYAREEHDQVSIQEIHLVLPCAIDQLFLRPSPTLAPCIPKSMASSVPWTTDNARCQFCGYEQRCFPQKVARVVLNCDRSAVMLSSLLHECHCQACTVRVRTLRLVDAGDGGFDALVRDFFPSCATGEAWHEPICSWRGSRGAAGLRRGDGDGC